MPELPEVETIKNAVERAILGNTINNVIVRQNKFREIIPDDFCVKICQAKIISLKRIAKYMLINLDNNITIIWHFGMSGKFKIVSKLPDILDKHDHVIIETDKNVLIYNDTRRFGLITYCESNKLQNHHLFEKLGLDPWDDNLTSTYLLQKFANKKIAIKLALLDQEIICGIGNIYASEILYKSHINPTRESSSINEQEANLIIKYTREILEMSIKAGGSTIHDYKHPDGNIGYFQNMHCVYGKNGQRCPNCCCDINKTGGIQKITQGGRSSFYCETLQK